MSPIPHLYSETKMLPVKEHLSLICQQFLVSALIHNHPSHRLVTDNSNPRPSTAPIRSSLQSRFLPMMQHVLTDGPTQADGNKEAISELHSSCDSSTIASSPDSPILHSPTCGRVAQYLVSLPFTDLPVQARPPTEPPPS